MCHRAHVRLVAVLHVAVHHIEMPLVDGQIDRLTDGAAGVMQGARHVGELHEVAEILDLRITTSLVEVAYKRRTICRGEDRAVAADDYGARRVAGVLSEFTRSGLADDCAAHSTWEADTLTLDVGTCVFQQLQRFRVIPEVDANLLQDRIRIMFEDLETLGIQYFVIRNLPGDVRDDLGAACRPRRSLRIAPTGTT